jgi:hypothetical protein
MSRERRDNRETGEVEGRRLKVGVQSSEHFSLQTISCVSLFPLVAHLSAISRLRNRTGVTEDGRASPLYTAVTVCHAHHAWI